MRNLLLILCLASVIGCGRVSDSGVPLTIVIDGPKVESARMSEVFSVDEWLAIEKGDSVPMIGMVQKIVPGGNAFYVADGKGVYHFGKDGDFIGAISKFGRGPGEYVGIMDFCPAGDYVYVLDMNRKLLKFDADGNCVVSNNLGFYPATIHVLESGELLLTSAYQGPEDKFHVYDAETLLPKRSFHEIDEAEITWRHFRGQKNFFEKDGELLFHEPMNNDILVISNDSAYVSRRLDIHGRSMGAGFSSEKYENVMRMNEEFVKGGLCAGAPDYAETEDKIVFTYRDAADFLMCRYDKRTGESLSFKSILIDGTDKVIPVSDMVFGFVSEKDMAIFMDAALLDGESLSAMGIDPDYDGPVVGLCHLSE